MGSLFPMEKWRLVGTVVILTLGLASLSAVLIGGGTLVAAPSIVGLFILSPRIPLLGSDVPLVGDPEEEPPAAMPDADPVDVLRERHARGDLSKEEFEARLDRLLETEDVTADRPVSRAEREVL